MVPILSKTYAVARAGGVSRLARILGLTPSSVTQWRGDEIPPLRRYQLLEVRPEWFLSQPGPLEG